MYTASTIIVSIFISFVIVRYLYTFLTSPQGTEQNNKRQFTVFRIQAMPEGIFFCYVSINIFKNEIDKMEPDLFHVKILSQKKMEHKAGQFADYANAVDNWEFMMPCLI